ncbi:hypothetical protein ACQP1U_18720 [Actinomycetota bacterium]
MTRRADLRAVLTALLATVALAGCSGDSGASDTAPGDQGGPASSASSASSSPSGSGSADSAGGADQSAQVVDYTLPTPVATGSGKPPRAARPGTYTLSVAALRATPSGAVLTWWITHPESASMVDYGERALLSQPPSSSTPRRSGSTAP